MFTFKLIAAFLALMQGSLKEGKKWGYIAAAKTKSSVANVRPGVDFTKLGAMRES